MHARIENRSMNDGPDETRESHGERLRTLPASDHARWDEFTAACPEGTIFHTAWWYRAWGMEPIVQVLVDKEGSIQAGLCYGLGRRWGTTAIVRPPMTARNGPVFARPPHASRHRQNTHQKKMLLLAIHSLPRLGMYDFLLCPCDQDVLPFLWNGFDTLVGYTHVLRHSERHTWLQHASKTQRWSLRRAAREASEKGFYIEENPSIEEVMAMLQETADVKNYISDSRRHPMAAWWQAVRDRRAGVSYLLRDRDGNAASSAMLVYDSRRAYYIAGGIRSDLRHGSLVNVLLIHRMIETAHEMGLDFDFEGSILPGVERFFRSFGGELQPVYRMMKFPSPIAYLIWHGHRYWRGHRRREWVWHD
jgi:hypothetical protein